MTDEFSEYWRANFPECPPVSYLFKSFLAERWLRIHSLPESKRYPDTDSETAEILRRQTTILDALIGRNKDCFFVGIAFEKAPSREYGKTVPFLSEFLTTRSLPVLCRDIEGEEGYDAGEAFQVEFGKGTVDTNSRSLHTVLLAIAEENLSRFFVVNPGSNRIFAPYDGGVDLILENSDSRNEFRMKYVEWLPRHVNGL